MIELLYTLNLGIVHFDDLFSGMAGVLVTRQMLSRPVSGLSGMLVHKTRMVFIYSGEVPLVK